MTLEEDKKIFMCFAALLCEQVYSAAVKCLLIQKCLNYFHSELVNCWLQSAGLGKKREETVKPTCFMSKATSVPQTPGDTSFTVFFDHWGVKFDRWLKISARWVWSFDYWVTCMLLRQKKSFPCFNAIWYDLWRHVAWRLKFLKVSWVS